MTVRPVRLRLSRAKGFNLQAHSRATNGLPAINCARPGPFGNPFVVGVEGTQGHCVTLFTLLMSGGLCVTCEVAEAVQRRARTKILRRIGELRGVNLACWCALDKPCHADVLLEIANRRLDQFAAPGKEETAA